MSFGLLWAANALLPGTVFSFMLVLFPRIIAIGISMRTLIGRNEASRTLAALRNLHLPERFIMIVAVIFRFFPVLSGDMKLLRQSIRTRGVFTSPLQKLRALSSYIEILTVPMALRVIRIAETLSASAETRGIDLTRRKSNYLSLRCFGGDVGVLRPAGSIDRRRPYPVIAVSATFNHISFKKESYMSTANPLN